MDQPSLRDRIAPFVPYWPWVVVPTLVVALILGSAQISAQGRRMDLMHDDITALEQQISMLKNSHGPMSASSLIAGLSNPQAAEDTDPPVRHVRRAGGEARANRPAGAGPRAAGAGGGGGGGRRRRAQGGAEPAPDDGAEQ